LHPETGSPARSTIIVDKLTVKLDAQQLSSNGGVLPLKLTCEVNQLPPQFQRIEVSPDNSAIRPAMEAGDIEAQKVAQFGERETHLSVL
jgi:hypothetical protein